MQRAHCFRPGFGSRPQWQRPAARYARARRAVACAWRWWFRRRLRSSGLRRWYARISFQLTRHRSEQYRLVGALPAGIRRPHPGLAHTRTGGAFTASATPP